MMPEGYTFSYDPASRIITESVSDTDGGRLYLRRGSGSPSDSAFFYTQNHIVTPIVHRMYSSNGTHRDRRFNGAVDFDTVRDIWRSQFRKQGGPIEKHQQKKWYWER